MYRFVLVILLVALAGMSELTLVDWKMGYAGEGYPSGHVATGMNALALFAHLQEG